MPNLLAMSFEGELAPSFDLRCLLPGRQPPDGWGIGYYPGGEPAATVLKEPAPQHGSIRSELVNVWEHLASSLFIMHIRAATWGHISDSNTQPFVRSWGRRDWLFAHAGSLRRRFEPGAGKHFEPVGSTDSEAVFCELLNRIASQGWTSLRDCDPEVLRNWFDEINSMGTLTSILSDGRDLAVYADRRVEETGVFLAHVIPPHERLVFGDDDLEVDLTRRGNKGRKGVIVCSNPLTSHDGHPMDWKRLAPGALLIVCQGAVMAEASPPAASAEGGAPARAFLDRWKEPSKAEVRHLVVSHRTVYRYSAPVERSTHVLRLTPTEDRLQRLYEHEVTLSVAGQQREYEDVFGNHVRGVTIDSPYTELTIRARSRVELRDTDPLSFRALRERTTIPLVWMPWQQHMLQPFLLPQELPDSELSELVEYAMSFVARNDNDLLDTLLDLNTTIFREYQYRKGSTTNATTPFEVYSRRRGVCQDFTNLFICLARLLGVPARYVCGYLLTGDGSGNRALASQASHAWAQVYLPEVGWKGFDPTNGVLTQTDHIRLSVGRSYVDATPTAGTIYVGGGSETLEVDVWVELAEGNAPA